MKVRDAFQACGVKVYDAGDTVAAPTSLLAGVMVTSAVGWVSKDHRVGIGSTLGHHQRAGIIHCHPDRVVVGHRHGYRGHRNAGVVAIQAGSLVVNDETLVLRVCIGHGGGP